MKLKVDVEVEVWGGGLRAGHGNFNFNFELQLQLQSLTWYDMILLLLMCTLKMSLTIFSQVCMVLEIWNFQTVFGPPLPCGARPPARPMARPKLQFISRTSTPSVNIVSYDFVALNVGNKIM